MFRGLDLPAALVGLVQGRGVLSPPINAQSCACLSFTEGSVLRHLDGATHRVCSLSRAEGFVALRKRGCAEPAVSAGLLVIVLVREAS